MSSIAAFPLTGSFTDFSCENLEYPADDEGSSSRFAVVRKTWGSIKASVNHDDTFVARDREISMHWYLKSSYPVCCSRGWQGHCCCQRERPRHRRNFREDVHVSCSVALEMWCEHVLTESRTKCFPQSTLSSMRTSFIAMSSSSSLRKLWTFYAIVTPMHDTSKLKEVRTFRRG